MRGLLGYKPRVPALTLYALSREQNSGQREALLFYGRRLPTQSSLAANTGAELASERGECSYLERQGSTALTSPVFYAAVVQTPLQHKQQVQVVSLMPPAALTYSILV